MKFPLVISFYTENTAYEKEAKELVRSCEYFDLDCLVKPIPSFGSWELNCGFKPIFILHILENLKRDLFWTDADSVFVKKPNDFPLDCDFAVRIDEDLDYANPSKVISNSIFIKYSPKTISLLKMWKSENERDLKAKRESEVWDQISLKKVLFNNNLDLIFMPMPKGFCKIADLQKDYIPKDEIYIIHYQASRLYKKWINKELAEFDELKSLNEKNLKKIRGF